MKKITWIHAIERVRILFIRTARLTYTHILRTLYIVVNLLVAISLSFAASDEI